MKLGIHYIYWQKDLNCQSYVPYVSKAKQLGFDVLELGDYLVLNMPEYEVNALASAAKEYDIELSIGLDPRQEDALTSNDSACRVRGIRFYCDLFPRLQKLGIKTLAGHFLNAEPIFPVSKNRETELMRGAESISQIGRCAAEYGISINIEIVNRFESHLLNTAQQGVAFAKEVGLSNVKLTLDTVHMNIEEDSFYQALTTAGNYLGHVHLCENNRRLPGKGKMPWLEIRDALFQIGYKGIMTMEPLVQTGGDLGDYARIWRDMTDGADEEMMDAAAAKAARFIRYLFGLEICPQCRG